MRTLPTMPVLPLAIRLPLPRSRQRRAVRRVAPHGARARSYRAALAHAAHAPSNPDNNRRL
jgi:hypothetical protein